MNEALASIAKACLRDERRTILDTARELGFADNTGFHRAFKRWTGLTPLEYRRQQAMDADDAAPRPSSRSAEACTDATRVDATGLSSPQVFSRPRPSSG